VRGCSAERANAQPGEARLLARDRNPGRVSCAYEIRSFQNFLQVLETCAAWRKHFFDTLYYTTVLPKTQTFVPLFHSFFSYRVSAEKVAAFLQFPLENRKDLWYD
jgi:hypothetical protein